MHIYIYLYIYIYIYVDIRDHRPRDHRPQGLCCSWSWHEPVEHHGCDAHCYDVSQVHGCYPWTHTQKKRRLQNTRPWKRSFLLVSMPPQMGIGHVLNVTIWHCDAACPRGKLVMLCAPSGLQPPLDLSNGIAQFDAIVFKRSATHEMGMHNSTQVYILGWHLG